MSHLCWPPRYPLQDDPCEPPPISEKSDPELWAAFQAFNLNPCQHVAWLLLAGQMAKVLFPRAGARGRPKNSGKRQGRHRQLVKDMAVIADKHPAWSMSTVCRELKKRGLYPEISKKTLYGMLTKRPKK
jgi:hypothetical protein